MTRPAHESTWVVDSLGETVATVEVDGKDVLKVPRWLLPQGTREKDVLVVTREAGRERVSLTVARDPDSTKAALEESAAQLRDAPVDGKGGDITL